MTNLKISPQAEFILKTLIAGGYEAYIVGGAVRDLLLGTKKLVDYDFATNAKPEEIMKLFPESFYENEFGTVMLTEQDLCEQAGIRGERVKGKGDSEDDEKNRIIDLAEATKIHEALQSELISKQALDPTPYALRPNYEITTYRSKELYSNFRKPEKLEWGETIAEDLERRDFTINAIALDSNLNLIDPYNGQADLQAQLLKAVGDPEIRFQEDALRMLRAIRFSVQLNFKIAPETFAAITRNCLLISHISFERIRDEFMKMLKTDFPAEAIELLDETGLLEHIIPELLASKGVEQGGHHDTDVWTHSLDALRTCPSPDPVVRLATLLHDISKPETQEIGARVQGLAKKQITFYNHEVIGARVAKKIAERLRLSKAQQERIFTLVRFHMFYYQPQNTDASIRRFMKKVGLNNIDDILDLREGDRLGSGARKTSWRLEEMKARMIAQLHQPMDARDLAISGHDLMSEFKLKPGPILGKILNELLERVLEDPQLNEKTKLLKLASELL